MKQDAENPIVSVGDDYSVIVSDSGNLQQFFTDGENLQKVADRIESMARNLVADTSTKEGISQIKTAARQIASVKKKVDDLGKAVVAELKALPKVIDKNRADFRERMENLQEEIRRPVTEIEEREKAIDDIKGTHFNCAACNSEELAAKIAELEAQRENITPEIWKESHEAVLKAYDSEIAALATMRDAAAKREAEQRELEELRKKKEEAEKRRIEAEERARREAMQREEEKAKARYTIPENRPASFPQQQEEKPAPRIPNLKPSKWTPEMKAVNCAIVAAIAAILEEKLAGYTAAGYELAAREIVKAIVNNKITNLSVRY